MIRAGFRMLIESQPDLTVLGEAESGFEAIRQVVALKPDVVLMDVQMADIDGITATEELTDQLPIDSPVRILIVTTFHREDYLFNALRAGASGFLLKTAPPEDLLHAIRVVAAGNSLLDPAVTGQVIRQFTQTVSDTNQAKRAEELTKRELEVLSLVARGLNNAEIAKELTIGETTTKTHVSSILSKLQLRDRVQIAVFAYESGLAHPGTGSTDH